MWPAFRSDVTRVRSPVQTQMPIGKGSDWRHAGEMVAGLISFLQGRWTTPVPLSEEQFVGALCSGRCLYCYVDRV